MDFELESQWRKVLAFFEPDHGKLDVSSVLFLIGIQELGKGFIKLSKDKKLEVMHIGVCTVLVPYGYYEPLGEDKDGWPHFENLKKLPALNNDEQQRLMKEAVVKYFKSQEVI
mgnify:CR=1 FL=1